MGKLTQRSLVLEYFKRFPSRSIPTPEVVDWVTREWEKRTGKKFRDPDRQIRSLHQDGLLIKVANGLYQYDLDQSVSLRQEFTTAQKKEILENGRHLCAVCGKGRREGVELHVDHIKPRYFGGKSVISNGQVLCSQHNNLKKNYSQTEIGKQFFLNLYQRATKEGDSELIAFCQDIRATYIRHGIDSHIEWKE